MLFGLGLCVVLLAFGGATLLVAQTLNSFKPGDIVSSSFINDNFDALKNRITPVGGIVAWHKDFTTGLALTDGWVECNGQVINDPRSPFNGLTVPNLNGDATGADLPAPLSGKYEVFLRGGTASGTVQTDQFASHAHWSGSAKVLNADGLNDHVVTQTSGEAASRRMFGGNNKAHLKTLSAAGSGTETRPVNMSVVWVMRIK